MSEQVESKKEQYLLFVLEGNLYAIKALYTSEIVEYSQVTKVPMMDSCIKGVTNIRGEIVPVVDLLNRLQLGVTQVQKKTSIVVVRSKHESTPVEIGIMIDEVYEVDSMQTKDIEDVPEFGSKFDKRYVSKMGKYNGNYIAILNLESILEISELAKIKV